MGPEYRIPKSGNRHGGNAHAWLLESVDRDATAMHQFHGKLVKPGGLISEAELLRIYNAGVNPVLLEGCEVRDETQPANSPTTWRHKWILWRWDPAAKLWSEILVAYAEDHSFLSTFCEPARMALGRSSWEIVRPKAEVIDALRASVHLTLREMEPETRMEAIDNLFDDLATEACKTSDQLPYRGGRETDELEILKRGPRRDLSGLEDITKKKVG